MCEEMADEIENEDVEYLENIADFLEYFLEKVQGISTPLICGKLIQINALNCW